MNNMHRKTGLSLVLLLSLCVSVVGCASSGDGPGDTGYFFELHVGDEMRCGVGFSLHDEPLYPALRGHTVTKIDSEAPVYCLVVRYQDYSSYYYLNPTTGSSEASKPYMMMTNLPQHTIDCLFFYCSTAPFELEVEYSNLTREKEFERYYGSTTYSHTYSGSVAVDVDGVTLYVQSLEQYESWFPVETMMGDYVDPAPYYSDDGEETFLYYASQVEW